MNSRRKKLLGLSLLIFVLFSILILQFYRLQIIEGSYWSKQAQKQHFLVIKEPFERGKFYGNSVSKTHPGDFKPLVMDLPKYHLYIDPLSIPSELHAEISATLISNLELSTRAQNHLCIQFNKKSRSRKLASNLDLNQHDAIQKWWKSYAKINNLPRNSIYFIKDYQRCYPHGNLLGQVLHTIQCKKDEKTDQALPTGGLELHFNHYLQGKSGKRRMLRSPSHSFETGELISPPENGADIYLTIDPILQAISEEELEKGVKKCQAKAGWAIIANPHTGEILALAQYPFFHPADYQNFFNDPLLIEHTKVKAITDANEPGSVFKPLTLTLALRANQILKNQKKSELINPDAKMPTANGKFPGRSKPITDTHLHPYLNMTMAMWKSSNIYCARLVERMIHTFGNEWYRGQLQEIFGIGNKTGIELPAESNGVLPKPGRRHPNGTFEWTTATPFSMAFGHNLQVTSLQLIRAYSVFANGGYFVQPTLVRKIVKTHADGHKEILIDNTHSKQFPRVLEPEIVQEIVRMMRYVTKSGGTASKGDIPGYTEAGKTSTAKKIVNGMYSEELYVGSFIGFAPVDSPAFVLIVTMDEPLYAYIPGYGKNHNGGKCAAITFREIGLRALEYMGIVSDDPHGYPYGDPRYSKTRVWAKETQKLQELYNEWNSGKKSLDNWSNNKLKKTNN